MSLRGVATNIKYLIQYGWSNKKLKRAKWVDQMPATEWVIHSQSLHVPK